MADDWFSLLIVATLIWHLGYIISISILFILIYSCHIIILIKVHERRRESLVYSWAEKRSLQMYKRLFSMTSLSFLAAGIHRAYSTMRLLLATSAHSPGQALCVFFDILPKVGATRALA